MCSHEPIRKHQQVRPELCVCSTKHQQVKPQLCVCSTKHQQVRPQMCVCSTKHQQVRPQLCVCSTKHQQVRPQLCVCSTNFIHDTLLAPKSGGSSYSLEKFGTLSLCYITQCFSRYGPRVDSIVLRTTHRFSL